MDKTLKIKIITDAGSDATDELLQGRDIEIIPMKLTKNDSEDIYSNELNPKIMYEDMRNGIVYKTSQISLYTYLEHFEKYVRQGYAVIYVGLSSGLSGTISTANIAAMEIREKYPDAVIKIIDSKCATCSYAFAAMKGYDLIEQGSTIDEAVSSILYDTSHYEHVFTVSDLQYLVRGGRLSKTACIVADSLNIRPVMNIDKQGKLIATEKVRGTKRLKARMTDKVVELSHGFVNQRLHVVHADAEDFADEMISLIQAKTGIHTVTKSMLGPTIGTHSGPGTLGLIFTNPSK